MNKNMAQGCAKDKKTQHKWQINKQILTRMIHDN